MAVVILNTAVLIPVPEWLDWNGPGSGTKYSAGLPVTAFLMVLIPHLG